jgi:hypothetical protein
MPESTSLPPADYEAKASHEATRLASRHTGPEPFGDPLSDVVLVVENATGTAGAKMADALRRSLAAVKLDGAYVTWSHPDILEEVLSLEPGALVAVGPAAASAIDSSGYPLVEATFSEAPEGSWFAWTKGTFGLKLPALAPALEDSYAKRRFWQAFLALRVLDGEPRHP